jgi:hypothetical protein
MWGGRSRLSSKVGEEAYEINGRIGEKCHQRDYSGKAEERAGIDMKYIWTQTVGGEKGAAGKRTIYIDSGNTQS